MSRRITEKTYYPDGRRAVVSHCWTVPLGASSTLSVGKVGKGNSDTTPRTHSLRAVTYLVQCGTRTRTYSYGSVVKFLSRQSSLKLVSKFPLKIVHALKTQDRAKDSFVLETAQDNLHTRSLKTVFTQNCPQDNEFARRSILKQASLKSALSLKT